MLNFEDEIKKFKPSPETGEADDAIYTKDLRDVNDVIQELLHRYPQEPYEADRDDQKREEEEPV